MLLAIKVASILPRDQIRKAENEGRHWEKGRKDNETEFALYRYGIAYLTGLSDRICARQTTPVFKFKRKHPSGKFISYCSSPARHMTERKVMNMRKKGNDAYSND